MVFNMISRLGACVLSLVLVSLPALASEITKAGTVAASANRFGEACDWGATPSGRIDEYRQFAVACMANLPADVAYLDSDAQGMQTRLNEIRAQRGLGRLSWSEEAERVARFHALDMLSRDYFAHRSLEGLGATGRLRRLCRRLLFSYSGENLAWFKDGLPLQYTSTTLQSQLENSPSHFGAMINGDYTHVGAAIINQGRTYIAVQVFLKEEGHLPYRWPESIAAGPGALPLPADVTGREVGGWQITQGDGSVLKRDYSNAVALPDRSEGPVGLVVFAAHSPTEYVLLNGPVFDIEPQRYP